MPITVYQTCPWEYTSIVNRSFKKLCVCVGGGHGPPLAPPLRQLTKMEV